MSVNASRFAHQWWKAESKWKKAILKYYLLYDYYPYEPIESQDLTLKHIRKLANTLAIIHKLNIKTINEILKQRMDEIADSDDDFMFNKTFIAFNEIESSLSKIKG